ncbi:hypothetical protein HK405_009539, partial [Cladochytrium tenue]
RDSTDVILAYHPAWVVEKKLPRYLIADLAEADVAAQRSKVSDDFKKLEDKLQASGMYKTNYWFYVREDIKLLSFWVVSLYLAYNYGHSWAGAIGSALCCAFIWHQGAFIAHDAGHSGITHNLWWDAVLGILHADFLGGLSLGWWKKNHNIHHIITNHPEHDPDIQHLPFLAVSVRFMESLYSTYYNCKLEFDSVAKMMIPLQHRLFYVILAFGRFNLYANSLGYLLGLSGSMKIDKKVPFRWLELSGLAFFALWYGTMLSWLGSWPQVLTHILIANMVTVPLHVQITISHFAMDTTVVENEDFATMALRTTMDIDCPRWLDWVHGGLQFQVAHHMFPRLPRTSLRRAQALVKEFAKVHGLPFHSFNFIDGNMFVLDHLESVGMSVRQALAKTA